MRKHEKKTLTEGSKRHFAADVVVVDLAVVVVAAAVEVDKMEFCRSLNNISSSLNETKKIFSGLVKSKVLKDLIRFASKDFGFRNFNNFLGYLKLLRNVAKLNQFICKVQLRFHGNRKSQRNQCQERR